MKKPTQLGESDMIPVPKKGDLSLLSNHCGVSISSIVAKVIKRMILNRIQPKTDPYLQSNQNKFRPGRFTTAHILALRRLIEGVKDRNLKTTQVFIDFKKAFNRIHKGKVLNVLIAYGIPELIIAAIGPLYTGKAIALTPDGETEFLEILAGVLQGNTLAPYIFTVILDYAMTQAIKNNAQKIGSANKIREEAEDTIPK